MTKKIITRLSLLLIFTFTLQLYACGTLMYPERRGQKHGEIDVKVAVLDGLGLLFCIVPGVVAYIVDFTTGAIYLPAGKRNMVSLSPDELRVIYLDKDKIKDQDYLREVISKEASLSSVVNWDSAISYSVNREVMPELTKMNIASAVQH